MKLAIGLLLAVFSGFVYAETVYVSDVLPINVRRGPDVSFGIIAQVKSGAQLTVLEKRKGYLKVRTPKRNEGWVLSRLVQDEPVARERLPQAESDLELKSLALVALQENFDALQNNLKSLEEEHQALQQSHTSLVGEKAALQALTDSMRDTRAENAQLSEQLKKSQLDLQLAQNQLSEQALLRQRVLLGGALVVLGIILGLILPRLPRRRPSW